MYAFSMITSSIDYLPLRSHPPENLVGPRTEIPPLGTNQSTRYRQCLRTKCAHFTQTRRKFDFIALFFFAKELRKAIYEKLS